MQRPFDPEPNSADTANQQCVGNLFRIDASHVNKSQKVKQIKFSDFLAGKKPMQGDEGHKREKRHRLERRVQITDTENSGLLRNLWNSLNDPIFE